MPNFSHPRHVILETLIRNQATTLQKLMQALGIGENYTPVEYLRVHKLMSRLLKGGMVSRASNPRHGLTSYTITTQGRNAFVELDKKISQELKGKLARKKKAPTEAPDDAPVVVRPVMSSATTPPSLDVVRCHCCGFFIPAIDVRYSLHATGTATCPKCQGDLTDVIGGTPVD